MKKIMVTVLIKEHVEVKKKKKCPQINAIQYYFIPLGKCQISSPD